MPDGNASFRKYFCQTSGNSTISNSTSFCVLSDDDFPWSYFCSACGVVLVMSIEIIVQGASNKQKKQQEMRFLTHATINDEVEMANNMLSPFILVIALDVHSLFAGIGLGVNSNVNGTLDVLWAILCHKSIAAFVLGTSLATLKNKKLGVLLVILFSMMTPLGIALGIVLSRAFSSSVSFLTEGILTSLAAGTFVYISIADILQISLFKDWMFSKLLATLVGWGFFSFLAKYT
eukprot:TRINITY_DN2831_c0_g2_i2.p1 TRINITY_DN2831_c0_g2~~TRINITY_DN2831_c0_g2_i2.p1  ORF type:complete len:233 (+),score=22.88 TRINITY_DN2831_c0_g2_i2:207-905(+)